MSPDDKAKVKSAIPEGEGKILHVTLVKIYHAHPDSTSWTYIGREGALVLVIDKIKVGLWFKMIDLEARAGTGGLTWEHRLQGDFTCYQDRPSFLSFSGESCMIGFAFFNEEEATALFEKLHDLDKYASETSQSKDKNKPPAESGKKKSKKAEKAFKSIISAPSHFEHVGHMSWSEHTGFTSRGVDNTWISVAGTLEKFRATEKPIEGSNHSIQNIFEKAGAEGLDAADKAYEITGTGEGTSERIIPLQSPPVAAFAPTEVFNSRIDLNYFKLMLTAHRQQRKPLHHLSGEPDTPGPRGLFQ
ncbi:hypothetical protein M407DRAFT_66460 [Tulasnella calospora MUT 4182]|uniref:WH1 domain-containing protein n=1 Tax=Tulasnella calospora MUT 4182 TaxID=1051891 RepID=A0A0C3MG45_9AGAM|nr:hypothetical protein M407DRAFT_66460 [Tulasnella calospora MUT 4182]